LGHQARSEDRQSYLLLTPAEVCWKESPNVRKSHF
jgi:hypothetical protein